MGLAGRIDPHCDVVMCSSIVIVSYCIMHGPRSAKSVRVFKAVVAGPAGPASAGPLFWPNMLSAVSLLPFQPLLSCLPVI